MSAPVEVEAGRPERGTGVTEEAGFLPRAVSLTEPAIIGSEMGVADLTREWGEIEFEVSEGFIDYLVKGNRVLLRLRDVGQLEPVARMAYEHNLGFEFGRYRDRVNVILYKNGPEPPLHELEGGGL